MLKRLLASAAAAILTAAVVIGQIKPVKASALLFTPNATVQSQAAILMNTDLNEIIYEKNADMKEMPGSLVQIMTAVIVLEECEDISGTKIAAKEEMYEIFEQDDYPEDLRKAQIEAGESLTVEDLLYAMMLTSSVEAAYMLCDKFGDGSQDKFAEKMNAKAEALGMTNTRFLNGTGLYSARQLTTARDLMTLLSYAMAQPRFETIACANTYTPAVASTYDKRDVWSWQHANLMVDESSGYYFNGVRGVKTANTQEGGRGIACKGSRDGNNYLLICMNSPMQDNEGNNHFYHLEDAQNILEWAFEHLTFKEIMEENTMLGEITVRNAEEDDFVLVKPVEGFSCIWCDTTDIKSVQKVYNWPMEIDAPVAAGQKIGTVTLKLSGETLADIDVVAASDVKRSFWKYNLSEIPGFFKSKYLRNTWVLGIVLSVLYIGGCIFFAFRYHEERKKRAAARAGHLKNQSR